MKEENLDVLENGSGEAPEDAAIGIENEDLPNEVVEAEGSAVNFESEMLAAAKDEPKAEDTGKEDDKKATLQELIAKLDSVDSDDANFKRLRNINKQLAQTKLEQYEEIQATKEQLESFGDTTQVAEALELVDGLFGYDVVTGVPTPKGFVTKLHERNPDLAFEVALQTLQMPDKNGGIYAERLLSNIFGLNPDQMDVYRAIAEGKTPAEYKDFVVTDDEIGDVPKEYHEAYKRLTPKLRDIVSEWLEKYATAADKAEAQRILDTEAKAIQAERSRTQQEQAKLIENQQKVVSIYNSTSQEATKTIATTIDKALGRAVFSTDEVLDATIKEGLNTKIFELVHDNPYIRERSEKYFTTAGVDVAKDRANIDKWYNQLNVNLEIHSAAKFRGQADQVARSKAQIDQAISHLTSTAIKYAARIADKAKVTLVKASDVNVPENRLPGQQESTASAPTSSSPVKSWKDFARQA